MPPRSFPAHSHPPARLPPRLRLAPVAASKAGIAIATFPCIDRLYIAAALLCFCTSLWLAGGRGGQANGGGGWAVCCTDTALLLPPPGSVGPPRVSGVDPRVHSTRVGNW